MKQKQIIALFGALALAATQLSAATPANKADALFDDPAIARGKGFEIKRSQLDDAFIAAKANAAANGVTFTEAERTLLEARLLNELIMGKILSARANDADKARAGEAADKFIAAARQQFPTEEAFNSRLKLQNLASVDDLRKKLTSDAIPSAVLERELKAQINVTAAQVKKFYTENPNQFEQPEMVRAAHVLIGTRDAGGLDLSDEQKKVKRQKIDDLLKRAKAGEDFGKLARQYSEDPGSKDNGGEYTFPRGQMVPEFETVAFSLKTNQISEVVTSAYGYHIIMALEKLPAKTVALAESSSKIKDYLTAQEARKLAPAYFEKAKKEAGVEILDGTLKAADKAAQAEADKP